jgi:hypothetical protein
MCAREVHIPALRFCVASIVLTVFAAIGPWPTVADGSSSPNFVPQLELSYPDPLTGERVSCGEGCRRFEVPAGVELELRISVQNTGGSLDREGVSWDLWFDQRKHPFPGLDITPCLYAEGDRVDLECWSALVERVDWGYWEELSADRVCVPSELGDCTDVTIRVPMDAAFEGTRGKGVYSIALWVDRFRVNTEIDEFDNFVGPVRVKVVPPIAAGEAVTADPEVPGGAQRTIESLPDSKAVVSGTSPRPYTVIILPERVESGFALSSQRSRGTLDFTPRYAGEIVVEVVQSGAYENIIVQVLKLSTGEILAETRGKGRIHLVGALGAAHLKDDRRFEVVVRADQGTRGARGTIAVSYPARAIYRQTD